MRDNEVVTEGTPVVLVSPPPVIYIAHYVTKEFIATGYADPDPLDVGNWLVAADAYLDAPPEVGANEKAVRSADKSKWEVFQDFRGQYWSTADGSVVLYTEFGPLQDGLTNKERPSEFHRWNGNDWKLDQDLVVADAALKVGQEKDRRLSIATMRIAPLQDAVEIGEATPADEALLLKWKKYRVAVNRVGDQPTYPNNIEWPSPPA